MAKRVALALCLMGSTPNLSHIAAYGAMAELVEAYFNTAGQAPLPPHQKFGSPTPGGFFQRYNVRKKKDGKYSSWTREAVPNAYISKDEKFAIYKTKTEHSVADFLSKDPTTLKRFWSWVNQDGGTNDLPGTGENDRFIKIKPKDYRAQVAGYNYTQNCGCEFRGVGEEDDIYMYSSGLSEVKLDDAIRYADSGKNNEIIPLDSITSSGDPVVDFNAVPSEGQVMYTFTDVQAGNTYGTTMSYEFENKITQSNTRDVTSTDFTSTSIAVDVEVEGEYAGVTSQVSTAYSALWQNTKTINTSEETVEESRESKAGNVTIEIKPQVAAEGAVEFNVDGENYFVEAGSDIVVKILMDQATFQDDLTFPHYIDATYGQFTLGTVSRPGVTTSSWQNGGSPWTKGVVGDGRIAHIVEYANKYRWWDAMSMDASTDSSEEDYWNDFIQVAEDDEMIKVKGSTTATTDVGVNVEVHVFQSGNNLQDSSSVSREGASFRDRRGNNGTSLKKLLEKKGHLKHLGQLQLDEFRDARVVDLDDEIDSIASRYDLSSQQKQLIPGYSLTSKDVGNKALVVNLPDRDNFIDLSSSQNPSLLFSNGSSGLIKLGEADDVIISARKNASSIFSGKGNDVIVSKGNGDFVNPGRGRNELHMLGKFASVNLNGGRDKIVMGEKSRASISSFRPGLSRIVAIGRGLMQAGSESFDGRQFRLVDLSRVSPGIFSLKNKSTGDIQGSVRLDPIVNSDQGYWLDYGLRIGNGRLLRRLMSNPNLSGLYGMNRFGSEMVHQVEKSLDELADLGKKYFLKRGFSQGSESYTKKFDPITGAKLRDNIFDFFEELQGGVLSSMGGGQALKDLRKRGLSIDLDAYQKPGDFLRELVSTSSVALDDSADVAQLFASIKSGLANKYDLPNVQLDAVS